MSEKVSSIAFDGGNSDPSLINSKYNLCVIVMTVVARSGSMGRSTGYRRWYYL